MSTSCRAGLTITVLATYAIVYCMGAAEAPTPRHALANGSVAAKDGVDIGAGGRSDVATMRISQSTADDGHHVFGHVGGRSRGLAVQDGLTYVAVGYELRIYDVSDPSRFVLSGTSALPAPAWGVAVDGHVAIVGHADADTMSVIDVSTPTSPARKAVYQFGPDVRLKTLAGASSGYAYALVTNDIETSLELVAIDVSDPESPAAHQTRSVISLASVCDSRMEAAISADRIFVVGLCSGIAHSEGWIRAYTLADLEPAGVFDDAQWSETFHDLQIDGDSAYVSALCTTPSKCDGLDRSIVRFDVGGGRLERRETYPVPGTPVAAAGDLLFVYENALVVLDASNTAELHEVSRVPLDGPVLEAAAWGNRLNVRTLPEDARELVSFDVSNPAVPVETARLMAEQWRATDVAIRDRWAYVATGAPVVRVVDVLSPLGPRAISEVSFDHTVAELKAHGQHLVAWSGYTVSVVDITDPTHPVPVATHDIGSHVLDIAFASHHWIVGAWDCLIVYDASDTGALLEVSRHEVVRPRVLRYSGGQLFVRTNAMFNSYEVSDDGTLVGMSQRGMDNSSSCVAFDVDGTIVYVMAGKRCELQVVDYADPSQPEDLGTYELSAFSEDVLWTGGHLLVSDAGGLRRFDVTRPDSIEELQRPIWLGQAYGVEARGRDAVIAHGDSGLVVVPDAVPGRPRTHQVVLPAAGR